MRASFSRIPDDWFAVTTPEPTSPRFEQMVRKRLDIALLGLTEARRCLGEGRATDVDLILNKVDEDLAMLRRRLHGEPEKAAPCP
jgi:hypothetical protein